MPTLRLTIVLAILFSVLFAPAALAAGPYDDLALGALAWMAGQQQPDGGFPGFSPATTADAVYAICAVGGDPNGFLQGGNSPISYLAANAATLAENPGSTAKLVLALVCAGHDPRAFAGTDWVGLVERGADPTTGQYGYDLTSHTFAVFALAATGRPVPEMALSWLRQAQTLEGGWSWSGDPAAGGADTNSTALALQTLVVGGAGASDPAIQAGLAYLHTQQNADGGFPYANPSPYGTATDANSTAYVIQALVAVGQDPEGSDWSVDGNTPLTALWKLQLSSGALEWQAGFGENALATYQAVPALMLKPFPLAYTTVGDAPVLLPETGVVTVLPASLVLVGLGAVLGGLLLRRRSVVPSRIVHE
jgi:hypothetical protein